MPAAIPLVATVAAGAAAISGSTTIALAITIAAQVASQALTKKPSLDAYRDTSERKQVLRAAASPKTVVYGRSFSAGTLFFSEEEPGAQDESERLHIAITLAGHALSSVGAVYLADEEIGTYGNAADYEIHTDRQTADPFMLKNCPSWKNDMIGRGMTWLRLSLTFDAEKFPSGIPNVRVEKFGHAVYDPRTGKTEYSNNAALCILHYYRAYLRVSDAELDWDQFQEAANICDEVITRGDGKTERRYTINGEFDLSENKASILEAMLTACGGEPTFIGGRHGILVGAYYGPALDEINESQLAGDIEIMPEVSQSERVNTINGTFVDTEQFDSEADFPPVSVAEWVAEDGIEITQDLKLRFVTSEFQAQRLADIKLKRTRTARTLNLNLNLSGYRYRPGQYVKLNLPSLGIVGVEVRVTDWKFGIQSGCAITVKQESADAWGDAIGQPITRPPLTNLTPGGVAQPQSLRYIVEEIGQVVQGVLSWQNVGQVAYNQVVIRRDGVPVLSVQVPGTFTRLTGLLRDTYTAHVIAVGFTGAHSPEAFTQFSIETPPPPSGIDVEQGYFSVTLKPRLAEITSISTQFDFWTSGEKQLPGNSADIVEAGATRAGIGTSWISNELKIDHVYHWYIRTINAFGASAFVDVAAVCSTDTGMLLEQLNEQIQNSETYSRLVRGIDVNTDAVIENAIANDADIERRRKTDGKLSAEILRIDTIILKNDSAYAEQFLQLTATADQNSAAVQQVSSAYADLNGKLSAQWGVKVQADANGRKYVSGMQLGVEGSGGAVQSYFLVSADTFGFYNPTNGGQQLALAIKNGQVFLSEALIDYASITLAKIGELRSANYVAGQTGTRMANDGTFEMNGAIAGSGRLRLTNNVIVIYDGTGAIKVKLGYLK